MRRLYPDPTDLDGAEELEGQYLLEPGRHVRADFVTSVDGAIEVDGRSGGLGGPADRSVFTAMRAVADAILVGAGTVRVERYGPVVLEERSRRRRSDRGQGELPALAVVSARGDLDPAAGIFAGRDRPILLTTATAAEARPDLARVADVVVCGETRLDLKAALDHLASRGLERVLCEGGPSLLGSLLQEGLLDELCLTASPLIAGAGHPTLTGQRRLAAPAQLRIEAVMEGDGMIFSRYSVVRAQG
ncbi:MAG: pyrimidine reductase family protein [Acidimicrobiales bacterium]